MMAFLVYKMAQTKCFSYLHNIPGRFEGPAARRSRRRRDLRGLALLLPVDTDGVVSLRRVAVGAQRVAEAVAGVGETPRVLQQR